MLTLAQWRAARCGMCELVPDGARCVRCEAITADVLAAIAAAVPPRRRFTKAIAAAVFPVLAFVAESHEYFLVEADGHRAPVEGVTDVLEATRMINLDGIPGETLRRARERGSRVHRALHYALQGDLKWDTVDPEDEPRIRAGLDFLHSAEFISIAVERRVYHRAQGYAGTVDAVGFWEGRPAVADWKCSANPTALAADLQLAAYAEALRLDPPIEWLSPPWIDVEPFTPTTPIRRIAVSLLPSGKWKPIPYANPLDALKFFSCLTVAREQRARGTRRAKENR